MRRVASILILTLLITSLFVFSFSTQGVEAIKSRTITKLFINPDFVSEPVGSNFTIAVKISNITNLFGLEIMLNWNPTVIEYINHTNKIPVETYPDGVLHEPVLWLPVEFNTTEGDYQIAVASFGDPSPPSFNGSGTVFEMTFDVVNIGFSPIDIVLSNLATKPNATHPWGSPIPHEVINGTFNNGPTQYQLIIDTVGLGTTDPVPGSYMYDQGTVVSVDAIPSQGWILDHWLLDGDNVGWISPYTITMDANHTLTAVFVEVTHDVAIINATTSKTGCLPVETVGQGYNVTVYVTVENQGNIVETFNVTIYVNISAIRESEVTLNRGENKTLMFVWNTAGFEKGNYTISATADIVLGETDTADNTMVDGTVLVTLVGDVDGDQDVDIYDIVRMAGIYGVSKPDSEYDPNCDMDDDGDIDIYDIVAAAGNYGESW